MYWLAIYYIGNCNTVRFASVSSLNDSQLKGTSSLQTTLTIYQ